MSGQHLSWKHLSWQHLSISGISQLLLTQFWPNRCQLSWWHLSRQHLSWWHLSILAISQLLLIHFLPNCLEQISLGLNLFGTTSCFWSLTFLDPTFLDSNLFLDPNSFNIKFVEPKFVLGPKSLVQSRFCHLYFEPKIFF